MDDDPDLVRKRADEIAGRSAPGDTGALVAHFMVGGVNVRTGQPRGERELHLGEAYAADAAAVPTALDYVALWNAAFIHSNDFAEAVTAFLEKRDPEFTGT